MKRFWKAGDPFVWITGGALAVALLMVAGLVLLIFLNGFGLFWPADVLQIETRDGRTYVGQYANRQLINDSGTVPRHRIQLKQGNRDLYGQDFVWIPEDEIATQSTPADLLAIERLEWGNLYGTLKEIRDDGRAVTSGTDEAWKTLQESLVETRKVIAQILAIEKGEIGAINQAQEKTRLRLRGLDLKGVREGPEVEGLRNEQVKLQAQYDGLGARLAALRGRLTRTAVLRVAGGAEKEVPLAAIVRVYRPNAMGAGSKSALYVAKVWEFVTGWPRESNTEGGILPAIFGTVLMVLLMSVAVTPLGVLAALYLREYARQGAFVSAVRIAVNNLAGVPSIVFGVFAVGFFIYFLGGSIDRLFYPESLPTPTFGTGGILWASLTLALLTVPVVIVATEEGLAAIPRGLREASMALGATKFETTWRVVLPAVMPSILTGLILAVARAAGEVAPLMLTGVVKLAPTLPVDGQPPFLHLDRKFMHLGFHIYDVGFQSPNIEASKPMVFATALLLLLLVILLNLAAVLLRKRLRRKLSVSSV